MNSYWKNKNQQFSYQRVDDAKYQQLLANCFKVIKFDRDWFKLSKQLMKLLLIFFNFLTH